MAKEIIGRGINAAREAFRKFHEDEGGMLVLTRKVDQGIVISGNIIVRVLGVERDRVKIGISAPIEVPVLRQELLDRDRTENEEIHDNESPADSPPATE